MSEVSAQLSGPVKSQQAITARIIRQLVRIMFNGLDSRRAFHSLLLQDVFNREKGGGGMC